MPGRQTHCFPLPVPSREAREFVLNVCAEHKWDTEIRSNSTTSKSDETIQITNNQHQSPADSAYSIELSFKDEENSCCRMNLIAKRKIWGLVGAYALSILAMAVFCICVVALVGDTDAHLEYFLGDAYHSHEDLWNKADKLLTEGKTEEGMQVATRWINNSLTFNRCTILIYIICIPGVLISAFACTAPLNHLSKQKKLWENSIVSNVLAAIIGDSSEAKLNEGMVSEDGHIPEICRVFFIFLMPLIFVVTSSLTRDVMPFADKVWIPEIFLWPLAGAVAFSGFLDIYSRYLGAYGCLMMFIQVFCLWAFAAPLALIFDGRVITQNSLVFFMLSFGIIISLFLWGIGKYYIGLYNHIANISEANRLQVFRRLMVSLKDSEYVERCERQYRGLYLIILAVYIVVFILMLFCWGYVGFRYDWAFKYWIILFLPLSVYIFRCFSVWDLRDLIKKQIRQHCTEDHDATVVAREILKSNGRHFHAITVYATKELIKPCAITLPGLTPKMIVILPPAKPNLLSYDERFLLLAHELGHLCNDYTLTRVSMFLSFLFHLDRNCLALAFDPREREFSADRFMYKEARMAGKYLEGSLKDDFSLLLDLISEFDDFPLPEVDENAFKKVTYHTFFKESTGWIHPEKRERIERVAQLEADENIPELS